MTFADPSSIKDLADREPRTTLFVLQCLDSSTPYKDLKKRIAESRKYIQDHYDQYLKLAPLQKKDN